MVYLKNPKTPCRPEDHKQDQEIENGGLLIVIGMIHYVFLNTYSVSQS